MGKKKLIVVWPYRFRDFDWQRFELEQLSQHVEVHVHELIDALTPEFAAAYANQSDRPEVKRFSSLKDWRREFQNNSEDAIVFSHVRPTGPKTAVVCLILRLSGLKTVGFLLGGPVIPKSLSGADDFLGISVLKRFYHLLRRNLLSFGMPNLLAIAGSESEELGKRDFNRRTEFLRMNSYDYMQFLINELPIESSKKFGVYLDTGYPGFPRDEALTGRTEIVTAENWYPSLNKFFSFVEVILGTKVDVAIHPKHVGRDHTLFFGKRNCIGGKTASLVALSAVVIATNSTSISYAVCYNKPLILIWSNLIESGVDRKKKNFILNCAKETGARIFNIDREYTENELRDALVIDHAKRESYKRKYLTSRTDDKPNYQVLLDEVINVVE